MASYDNINIFGAMPPESMSGVGQPNFLADTLSNVPSSAYQLGSDVAQVVTNPVQTLDAIGNLGLGLIALAIPDAYQEEKLDKPQEAALAVGQYISDRYGGFDKVKETLRTDPVGMLADVSGVLLGGGYLATKAGLKVGQVATKAGIATDPLIIAGKGASEVGKGVTRRDVLKGAGAGLASLTVPMSMMTDVTKAIPPVAKSTGILASIGKFRGILDNISPYLRGAEKRDKTRINILKAKPIVDDPRGIGYDQAIRNAFETEYPTIGLDSSFGLRDKLPGEINHMDEFSKKYNLADEDFSVIITVDITNPNTIAALDDFSMPNKIFDARRVDDKRINVDTKQSFNELQNMSRNLDVAPDKKVTVEKTNLTPEKAKMYDGADKMEEIVTSATVEGVPVMRSEVYTQLGKGQRKKINELLFIPNEAGLAKLAKAKPNLAQGGSINEIDIFGDN